jgi:alpha-aminoadipate carrier protein LysW
MRRTIYHRFGDAMNARCPVCGKPIEIPEDPVSGELVDHVCGATIEIIVSSEGIRLKPFQGVGEDWGE